MQTWLKLEHIALFLLGFALFLQTGFAWWLFLLLLLAPDASMLGYLAGPRIGALCYNLVHHQFTAVLCLLAGFWLASPPLSAAGAILLAHANMDRIFGYGLKYADSFQNTHLGTLKGGGQRGVR